MEDIYVCMYAGMYVFMYVCMYAWNICIPEVKISFSSSKWELIFNNNLQIFTDICEPQGC